MANPYPLSAIRALILHTQALTTPPGGEPAPTGDEIYKLAESLMCVQIDTLHMVQRSQYLVIWSRLGQYNPADFDRLIYDPAHRRLFEYWQHAASIIPLAEYRYQLPQMRWFAEHGGRRDRDWRAQPENLKLSEAIMARIRADGAVRSADFKREDGKRGTWWNWKPAKRALEYGYNQGTLMISKRVNFQRFYDLAERVLPDWVDTTEPTPDEANRHLVERAARAMGAGTAKHLADYAYMRRGTAQPYIDALHAEGILAAVQAELMDGKTHDLLIHRDNLPLLMQAADGAIKAERTTFLSPFDSLFWTKKRDILLWNFRQVLEAYKPAAQREWGYFCLPILHKDRLVGRFDPKLERKSGTLRLRALYLEPGVVPGDALVSDVAGAMRDFMAFHDARELVIERSEPAEFGERLAGQVILSS